MQWFSKKHLAPKIQKYTSTRVIYGLESGEAQRRLANADDFFYVDHSYFRRDWKEEMFRLIRGDVHLHKVQKYEEDRLPRFGVELQPWRKNGRRIVVIDPSKHLTACYGLPDDIAYQQAEELKKYTDREIFVKRGKEGLLAALEDAWACVCPVSVAGVEAAVFGVPVFSLPVCPSYPISAGELKDIEKPEYKDRFDWCNSLCWACWNWRDIPNITYKTYQQPT